MSWAQCTFPVRAFATLPSPAVVCEVVIDCHDVRRLADFWAAALESRRDEAIALQSEEVYDRYIRYLTGCADLFRDSYTDVCQFTLTK